MRSSIVLNRDQSDVRGRDELGRFRLDLARRGLRCDQTPVRLGSRAFDVLCVLASAKGKVVSKDELMVRVWGGVIVEKHNIQVHISALRRAFEGKSDGEGWIVTVPGNRWLAAALGQLDRIDEAKQLYQALINAGRDGDILDSANLAGFYSTTPPN